MKKELFILSLDQGTTSSRALLVDHQGQIRGIAQKEFGQIYPKEGWVEHDPMEIWETQLSVLRDVLADNNVGLDQISSIGITNQRETTVFWNKETGAPVYNAIVWQDKRTVTLCRELKAEGLEDHVRSKTGLVIDSYFCATKINWILDHVAEARSLAEERKLCFGTIDSWLIWNLTKGKAHVTDHTNASRTMLYDIQQLQWDDKLLTRLGVPKSILPEVVPSASHFGNAEVDGHSVPIHGVAGDQQAALFGQSCFEKGTLKNTYGTGCFLLLNVGNEFVASTNGLLTTLACSTDGRPVYALEGSVFVAGAAIQWLRDGLKVINDARETDSMARASNNESVVVVPAFAGLGAPYWNMEAQGAIFGLTRGTNRNDLVRATLESLAFQTKDVVDAMMVDSGLEVASLNVDGGAAANNYLMQFQADMLQAKVNRPSSVESTALGAAYLAGIGTGIWEQNQVKEFRNLEMSFQPQMSGADVDRRYGAWKRSVRAVMEVGKG